MSLTLGVAITTVGRPALQRLLESLAASTYLPTAVAVANQSGRDLPVRPVGWPFPVLVTPSRGGASRGRNEAVSLLPSDVDLLWFPNDDSHVAPETLGEVAAAFESPARPAAVAGALVDPAGARFPMPQSGTTMDRWTVWRAIEPTTFVRRDVFERVGGFREDIGTGSPGLWQSGEGTDLLLRVLATGGTVLSQPEIEVLGPGERRDLSDTALARKHRGYARGTGFVYRVHDYPLRRKLLTLLGPWRAPLRHATDPWLSLRLAWHRSVGRLEGLLGRRLSRRGRDWTGQ